MNIARAIKIINPNAQFVVDNDDINKITWIDTTPISASDITAKLAEADALAKAEIDALGLADYQRARAAEYPDYGIQLDYIYHNGLDKWKTDIVDPVKTKYPKPS